jgi:hypothetical protein
LCLKVVFVNGVGRDRLVLILKMELKRTRIPADDTALWASFARRLLAVVGRDGGASFRTAFAATETAADFPTINNAGRATAHFRVSTCLVLVVPYQHMKFFYFFSIITFSIYYMLIYYWF